MEVIFFMQVLKDTFTFYFQKLTQNVPGMFKSYTYGSGRYWCLDRKKEVLIAY